jgi:hypothetical protein
MVELESSSGWKAAAVALLVSGCVTSAELGGKPGDDASDSAGETASDSAGEANPGTETEPGDGDGDTSTGSEPVSYEDVVEPGPALAQGRYRHVAIELDDGTVFIGGGYDGNDTIASVEIFRPAQNDVVPGGALLNERFDACGVRLLDGRVMIVGGTLASSDIWDPATQQTEVGPPLNAKAGYPMCMITDDGTVLVADSFVLGKDFLLESWQPGDASFTELPSATERIFLGGHSGRLLGGGDRVLLLGGLFDVDGLGEPPPGTDVDGAQIYDLTDQVYRNLEGWDGWGASLIEPSGDALVYRWNNLEFVAARLDTQSETFEDITPSGPYNLQPMASMRTDGIAIMAGGLVFDGAGETVVTDRVLRWDPAVGQIEAVSGTLGEARSHGTATRLSDGRIAIIGGGAGNLASNKIDIYR